VSGASDRRDVIVSVMDKCTKASRVGSASRPARRLPGTSAGAVPTGPVSSGLGDCSCVRPVPRSVPFKT
jgi:hypothetical protein